MKRIDATFMCINDGMFENPDDHHAFWHCANGNSYLKYCPAGLIWSQVEQQCVYNIVETTVAVTASSSTTTTTTETVLSTIEATSSEFF
ncbi:unnamed protein product [Rotaria sp. Silwood2]|nr:unnamed protein product [Rotaria sp. Silwood2]CAF3099610.1 unnamed protein product [Rotaria sp. Silwood2]CAF3326279.1 unnamed protein product [Rotaria sp. Silwood2]CAF3873083.1 unnamed protein product [Rotaria sp. Silwood2]CAF3925265.1 unnamed protein product [Rotaria sp. Silwood2]